MCTLHFTGSMQQAVNFMVRFAQEGMTEIHPDLVQPDWGTFTFFSAITPGEIVRGRYADKTVETPEHWPVMRTIEFCYLGKVIAILGMSGRQYKNSGSCPRHSVWAIHSIRYARTFRDKKAENWVRVSWEPGNFPP